MHARFAPQVLIIVPFLLLAVFGCRPSSDSGIKLGNASWTTSAENPTPGIDEGSVSDVTLKSGADIRVVVWADLPKWSGGGGGSPPSYQGQHGGEDGRKIDVYADSADRKSATVIIAGKKYDSSQGALFLVSTQTDPPTVSQIQFDTNKFPKDRKNLAEFAKANEEILTFFQKHKKDSGGD